MKEINMETISSLKVELASATVRENCITCGKLPAVGSKCSACKGGVCGPKCGMAHADFHRFVAIVSP
jgi:hypothetical protein